MKTVQIGYWIETESRDIQQCPSYYAADTETLRTKPGRYPLMLQFVNGYTIPMPYWLMATIDADRIEGFVYSGFGGMNYACQALPQVPKPFHLHTYDYHLKSFVEAGQAELFPEWERLLTESRTEFAETLTWGEGLLA